MNLGKIKFEKVNMKIVVAAGACVIAILTAIFIVVRTNLIIDHSNSDKNNNPETEDNSNNKPNNPSNPDGEPGDNEEPPSTPGSGDDSNDNGDSQQKPNYDDPEEEDDDDENKISKSVKNRTKKAENLTVKEKEYILQDNVTKKVTKNKSMRTTCVKDSFCAVKVKNYTTYSTDEKIGKNITGCSGNIIFYYNSKKKEVVYDMQDVKCK